MALEDLVASLEEHGIRVVSTERIGSRISVAFARGEVVFPFKAAIFVVRVRERLGVRWVEAESVSTLCERFQVEVPALLVDS